MKSCAASVWWTFTGIQSGRHIIICVVSKLVSNCRNNCIDRTGIQFVFHLVSLSHSGPFQEIPTSTFFFLGGKLTDIPLGSINRKLCDWYMHIHVDCIYTHTHVHLYISWSIAQCSWIRVDISALRNSYTETLDSFVLRNSPCWFLGKTGVFRFLLQKLGSVFIFPLPQKQHAWIGYADTDSWTEANSTGMIKDAVIKNFMSTMG